MTDETRVDRAQWEQSFEAFLSEHLEAPRLPVPPQPSREEIERLRRGRRLQPTS